MKAIFLTLIASVVFASPKHIIMIGVDGLGSEWVRQNDLPNIKSLMEQGSWTLRARGIVPTVSSPNWASMIMGAGPAQHGIVTNKWEVEKHEIDPICQGSAKTFPTIFGILREHKPSSKIVIIHDWQGFARMVEPNAATFSQHVKGSPAAMDAAIAHWKKEKPELLFVHLDDVDHAGHDHGWGGKEYQAALHMVDGLIGKMITAIGSNMAESVVFVSADHGGTGKEHGNNNMKEIEIPWILAGHGVKKNTELKSFVNTYDTAATMATLLKVKPPACWIGRSVHEALK